MTISEAIEALKPLVGKLNHSVHIESPSVWLRSYGDSATEITQWSIWAGGEFFQSTTLDKAVQKTLDRYSGQEVTVQDAEAAVVAIEALATAS